MKAENKLEVDRVMKRSSSSALSDRRALTALLAAVVLAAVHQYFFFGQLPGISVPLFILLFYAYMQHYSQIKLARITWFGWFLFAVIALLSLTYGLFANPIFNVLNFLAIPPLIALHWAHLLGAPKQDWCDPRLIAVALDHLIPRTLRHIPTPFRILRSFAGSRMGEGPMFVLGKVFIGLAVSLPLLAIVINLLTSADGLFNHVLGVVPEWFRGLARDEGIQRALWIAVLGLLLFGYLWGFIDTGKKGSSPEPDGEITRESEVKLRRLFRLLSRGPSRDGGSETGGDQSLTAAPIGSFRADPIVIATVLAAVNVVYVLFVIVQFSYLFGAWSEGLPDGLSYAEYARSGFFELVAVSVINFGLLSGVLTFGGRGSAPLHRLNQTMLFILTGCTGMMLYSAFSRLVLYEEAYGYTYFRFLVHAFMLFLAALLVIAGLRISIPRIPLAKCIIVAGLIAYTAVNYAGMDAFIAKQNIERYYETGKIDEAYLLNLSADAVPQLLRFSSEAYPALQDELERKWREWSQDDPAWPAFAWSRHRAKQALAQMFAES
jgi:hypothetical protein